MAAFNQPKCRTPLCVRRSADDLKFFPLESHGSMDATDPIGLIFGFLSARFVSRRMLWRNRPVGGCSLADWPSCRRIRHPPMNRYFDGCRRQFPRQAATLRCFIVDIPAGVKVADFWKTWAGWRAIHLLSSADEEPSERLPLCRSFRTMSMIRRTIFQI